MTQKSAPPTVAVAGGGLAGLAAACALSDSGFRVTLFERRPYLGGRASSYQHPGTGEVIDNCQHVLFRVCTNLVEFYRRIGVEDKIRWYDEMTFIEPGGRCSVMHASALPAPLHTAPSFLRFPFLSAKDKLVISRAIAALTLTALPVPALPTNDQRDTGLSFQEWLLRHGQTENAIQRFWRPILVSALSEDLELISIPYAAQVVRESMKSPEARHMGVPSMPLTDLYNRAGDYIRARGGEIRFRNSLESFAPDSSSVHIRVADREEVFDYLVLALPYEDLGRVLPETPQAAPLRENLSHFESSSITGIHLWFDRQISDLDHAVLLDRTIQWMFHKSRLLQRVGKVTNPSPEENDRDENGREGHDFSRATNDAGKNGALAPEGSGSYIELVVSASKSLIDKSRTEIVDLALKEVREFFPAARAANLLKSTVIKEVRATYSPRPGIDTHRPPQTTPWARVFLAGDWTATGWPATMEGAVRSGYLAAEALTRAAGIKDSRFVIPDLPATGLMRLFR
ncbi:MAG TPA: hydroxysqualene dehydroxylase HpnE [Candidatus Eremiobacteraceae bacterium]|nr:hydroxysqualene dehydroxylase HpnE [Candidatus Eremiobacteraceae bacterium]